jgi:hypothetical protein
MHNVSCQKHLIKLFPIIFKCPNSGLLLNEKTLDASILATATFFIEKVGQSIMVENT